MAAISKEECWHSVFYTGAADDLVREGIIHPDQIPGLPGKPKTSMTFFDGEMIVGRQIPRDKKDHRYLQVQRQGRKLRVTVGIPRAEAEARRKADQEATAQQVELERKRKTAEEHLKRIPDSEEDCRRLMVSTFRDHLRSLLTMTLPVRIKGYNLDEDSAQAIQISADAVVEAMMEATFVFDPEFEHQCRATIAAADPRFQHKMASLTRVQPDLLEGERA